MTIQKLSVMVVLTELYSFIPFSVTLIIFQGHSNVNCPYVAKTLTLRFSVNINYAL